MEHINTEQKEKVNRIDKIINYTWASISINFILLIVISVFIGLTGYLVVRLLEIDRSIKDLTEKLGDVILDISFPPRDEPDISWPPWDRP